MTKTNAKDEQIHAGLTHLGPHVGDVRVSQKPRDQRERKKRNKSGSQIHPGGSHNISGSLTQNSRDYCVRLRVATL